MVPFEALMVGTSVTSASCCLASARSAGVHARLLAIAMVVVMVGVVITDSLSIHYLGAAALVVVAFVLLYQGPTENPGQVEWHRGLGGLLMAAAIVLHAGHASRPPEMAGVGMGSMHGMETGAGPSAAVLLQLATLGYLAWTAAAVHLMRRRHPSGALLRWEHAAMASSLAVMTFGMAP